MSEIHTFSRPAGADRDNEDALAVESGIGVVVDGAGLPKQLRGGCRHSVRWYAQALAAEYGRLLVDRQVQMASALASAIGRVAARHPECDLAAGSPSATAAAFRVNGDQLEYLVLCDASIILRTREGAVTEITDDRLGDLVGPVEAPLTSPDEIWAARTAVMARTRNRPGGFWCCHHDPGAAAHALVGSYPMAELDGVIAASDGATRGHQSLGVLPLEEFADEVFAGRAAPVADRIRATERDRAEQLRSRATKVHDDLTAVWLANRA
ncbi:protein phosphatase 2C domain-containing protein [Luteococcus sp. H138]|uniref:protein phosphatase 2C domain-containing protein n=1 Tax=unclassified Luteococcus TaxID=2639923 RepID=UPI00313C7AAF